MKNCLGIEIGHYRIKIAYAEKGELKEFISERVQGMDLTDMHVCADLIKDLLKEYAIRCRNVVFVIRQEDVYVRRFEMPLMTEEQLRLNLPYEFHDYIGDEMDKYVFDYAMIQTKERTMDLLGAACTKTLSQQFGKDGAPEARRPGPGSAWSGADSGVCTRAKGLRCSGSGNPGAADSFLP